MSHLRFADDHILIAERVLVDDDASLRIGLRMNMPKSKIMTNWTTRIPNICVGVSLVDRVPNVEIQRKTKVEDVGKQVTRLRWRWVGHLARRSDDRLTKAVTEWWPRGAKRSVGRPPARWSDDIIKLAGPHWTRLAQDLEDWRCREEAYTISWWMWAEDDNDDSYFESYV
ncbi:hypothetical protein NE865_00471 [Phthorimaea operculella]|nr:hypothetical protein NE865_00471 [Phthorimaea operculella]